MSGEAGDVGVTNSNLPEAPVRAEQASGVQASEQQESQSPRPTTEPRPLDQVARELNDTRAELSRIVPGVSRKDDKRAAELRQSLGLEPLTYKNGGTIRFKDLPRFIFLDVPKEMYGEYFRLLRESPAAKVAKSAFNGFKSFNRHLLDLGKSSGKPSGK